MSRKFVNIEIIFLYFLLLIPWPHTQVIKVVCSKDSSRLVRKIVRSKWTPILDKHQVKLPLECPLHPLRDLYAPRQDAKKRDRPTQWTCRLCGKSFYQEKFLDLHFEMRHKSTLNEAEDAVCLADFCDIMRCDVFQTEESSSLRTGDQHIVTDIEVWGDSLGQNSALSRPNIAYLSLLPLRTSSIGASRAAKVQNRQLYQDNNGQSTFKQNAGIGGKEDNVDDSTLKKSDSNERSDSPGGPTERQPQQRHPNKQDSTKLPNNHSDKLNNSDDSASNNKNNNSHTNGQTIGNSTHNDTAAAVQKVRAHCKPEQLSKLKTKCEYLVRSCITGLLLSMTDQAFKDMEEEMNKAVCWYLTCDRYWEDGPLEPRAFPWGLILILIFVLSTGICFCYYIIWILFDSEETTINANHPMYMHHAYQQYPSMGGMTHGLNAAPHYYYQQQQEVGSAHDLYPEPPVYDYRHSPRRYIADQRPLGTPTAGVVGSQTGQHSTPLHHHLHSNLGYPQDILDRRDYISRPIATTAVTGSGGSSMGPNSSATNATTAAGSAIGDPVTATAMDGEIMTVGGGGGASMGKHYNTHPRHLETHHRHAGASQQSLRGSSSSHEIIQNEVGQNEHYIYVTYPPDLKKRFFEKYE